MISFITVIFLLAAPLVLLVSGFALPCQYEDTFLGELKYKCRRLDETEGRRIVFVGGSGVAFGIDSGLVERELPDYTAVNFGMYAALGTRVMLDLSADSLREGDIVILCPEQQEQALSGYLGSEYLWQGVDGAFYLLSQIDRGDWGSLAGAFPAFAASKLRYTVTGKTPQIEGVYTRSAFDEYGDIVSPLCDSNRMPGGYDTNTPILFQPDLISEEFIDAVNRYADSLSQRGIAVWYHFCPMNELAVETGADIDGYYDLLQEKLHCPIIGNPSDAVLEAEWFYDTNFHLNASGKTVYTRQMIRDIKAVLGDSSPTEIALPEPPAQEASWNVTGDNSDAGCFTYVRQKDAVTLTGLTEQGSAKSALTVPVSIEGCPVSVIPAGLFAGNPVLEQVTIQRNITRIEDGAFEGCTALRAILLESDSPERCTVGQGLLSGTDAVIYVPEDAVSAYKLSYFWSQYGTRIEELDSGY